MKITPIRCLQDNYAYLMEDGSSGLVGLVDASELGPVLREIERLDRPISAVFCTHHHFDHVGANEALAVRYPGIKIYAHASDRGRVPAQTDGIEGGGEIRWGGMQIRVHHVPGHTTGAVSYEIEGNIFTGDTLFMAGCGRLFEGTAEMMHRSLNETLAAVPGAARVYCGHEYTVQNLLFAAAVEPGNSLVASRLERACETRQQGGDTMGTTLDLERATNPFLRCGDPEVRAFLQLSPHATDVDAFAALRRAKDQFRAVQVAP